MAEMPDESFVLSTWLTFISTEKRPATAAVVKGEICRTHFAWKLMFWFFLETGSPGASCGTSPTTFRSGSWRPSNSRRQGIMCSPLSRTASWGSIDLLNSNQLSNFLDLNSASLYANFASSTTNFNNLFPKIRSKFCTLHFHFFIPFFRDLLLSLGMISVDSDSIMKVLMQPNQKYDESNMDGFQSNAVSFWSTERSWNTQNYSLRS